MRRDLVRARAPRGRSGGTTVVRPRALKFGYVTIDALFTMRALVIASVAAVLLYAQPAVAHPTPFSYLDVRVSADSVEVVLVAHIIDIAHDLNVDPPERLLQTRELALHGTDITTMLQARFRLQADGGVMRAGVWSSPIALPERQSLQMTGRFERPATVGMFRLDALMFPYDPMHQTFVNFYESDALAIQAILDPFKTSVEFFSGSRQGVWAVVRRLVASGFAHVLAGPEHVLFLVGLLLLGGTVRRLALVASAFTIGHSLTLTLASLNLLSPPARIIEPAIALGIVYVGADNLMVHDGRDLRAWIAFGVGCIHGFGFANVLRQMDLPRRALGWSIASFGVGVEGAQLVVVGGMAVVLALLLTGSDRLRQRVVFAGSVVVMLGGAFWFIERVFFPSGLA